MNNEFLFFVLGLPIGAVCWIGIGLQQAIAHLISMHVNLNLISYFGTGYVILALVALWVLYFIAQKLERIKCVKMLMYGFGVALVIEPLLFFIMEVIG